MRAVAMVEDGPAFLIQLTPRWSPAYVLGVSM